MSVEKECASLVLNTRDAVSSNLRATNTWNNINLENLLEGMYDKYDTFNLCLRFTMTSANILDTTFSTLNDRNLLIYVRGLPFKAQCYKSGTNKISNEAVLGFILFDADTTTSVVNTNYESSYIATFTKTSQITNITIELRRLDNTLPIATNNLPNIVYAFYIYGVEPKTKLIDNRMK